jgi:hypothetical protein
MLRLALAAALGSCGPDHKTTPPESIPDLTALRSAYLVNKAEAEALRDPETGWLARWDCDGIIWAGKADLALGGTRIEAAEYPDAPGKFGRRPPPYCWTPEGGDQGAATEWSRDMGVAGLLPWAWLAGRRDVLERHAAYGRAHDWWLGEPTAAGQAYYTPAMRGLLAKVIAAMGGEAAGDVLWPSLWPSGLVDYEAHLQVMGIWLQGEAAARAGEADAMPARPAAGQNLTVDISNEMYLRLEEHAAREPRNPLFAYVLGRYTGDLAATVAILVADDMPVGEYVRCAEPRQCRLAEWLWVATLVLRDLGAVP